MVGTGPIPKTVQISGTAEALDDAQSDFWMNEFLVKREGFYVAFLRLSGYDFVCYKVTPDRIRWLNIPEEAEQEDFVEIKP